MAGCTRGICSPRSSGREPSAAPESPIASVPTACTPCGTFYASVLLANGVSIKELATDYLGHADPGFTLRTYTHLVPSSHERARLAIDGVFGRPASTDGLDAA